MRNPTAQRVPWVRDPLLAGRVGAWLVLAGLVVAPLSMVVAMALGGNHVDELLADGLAENSWNSVWTSILAALGSVAAGTALAMLLDRSDLPGRRWLRLLALTPMLVPPFIGAIAWSGLLGPGGTLNTMFGRELWNINGGDGVVFLLIIHSTPLAYLIIAAALHRVPSQLEEAARIAGASPLRAFRQVTLPMLKPAVVSAFTLTAVSCLGDFGIPALVGVPARFHTLSTMVYRYIQSGTVESPLQVVSQVGVVLLVLGIAGVVADYLLAPGSTVLSGGRAAPLSLGAHRWWLGILTWVGIAAATLLPLGALAYRAVLPAPGIPLTLDTITLDNFVTALSSPNTQQGIVNSLFLSLAAGVVCTVLGTVIALLVTQVRSRDNAGLVLLTLLPQAVPGTIIAVGWLIAGRYSTVLYNTRWLILLAYATAFTSIVLQSVRAPLAGTPAALLEAARLSGASQRRAIWDISVRLARPAALTGGMLVILTAVRELTLSALLMAPGTQTLGVAIFNLQQAGDWNSSSALSFLVAVVGVLGLGLVAGGQTERNPRGTHRR